MGTTSFVYACNIVTDWLARDIIQAVSVCNTFLFCAIYHGIMNPPIYCFPIFICILTLNFSKCIFDKNGRWGEDYTERITMFKPHYCLINYFFLNSCLREKILAVRKLDTWIKDHVKIFSDP